MRAIERAGSGQELKQIIRSSESQEAVVELIAYENHIPKVIARRLYRVVAKRLSTAVLAAAPDARRSS